MIKTVAIIGLGSIGGFLAKHLSEYESIRQITLVDFDIVETKNIGNSVYDFKDIGELKVDAISKIIEDNVNTFKRVSKYIEGKTWIPNCDLIIDCRDFVYDRSGSIDMRVYISGKILIMDCRKNFISSENYQGNYNIKLTKQEMSKATYIISQVITNDDLPNILKNELIYKTDLSDYFLNTSLEKCIKDKLENRRDIIYDSNEDIDRLQCIDEYMQPILESNKSLDIPVYVNDLKERPDYVFPKGLLREPTDVINSFLPIISSNRLSNFLITLQDEKNGGKLIRLLEETAAA